MLNAADIVILAVLALSVLMGLWRGFVGEVLALATWVAAFWVAWILGGRVAALYAHWLDAPSAGLVAGYLTCFLAVLVAGALVAWCARRVLGAGGLRGGDRALGGLFGLARGLLVVLLVVAALGATAVPREAGWWRGSLLLPPFESGARWLAERLPPAWGHPLEAGRRHLQAASRVPILDTPWAATSGAPSARSVGAPAAAVTLERGARHVRQRPDVGQ